jgi:hypothetical protein
VIDDLGKRTLALPRPMRGVGTRSVMVDTNAVAERAEMLTP